MKEIKDIIDRVHCCDCLEFMKEMPPDCIDTIITDPPYGLGFMGKGWDTFKPEFVSKGVKSNLGNGSKKARGRNDTSPAWISARYDHSRNAEFQAWFTIWSKEALRVLKPGGTLLIFGGTRTYHRLACAIEDAGFTLKDCIMWLYGSGFPKATDISKQLDKSKGLKRTGVIKTDGSGSGEIRTTSDRDRQLETVYETGEPISPQAQLWNGWKSHGLKPAYEPILVAMKPNDGTYAANALKWGVSGLNIDGTRIGDGSDKIKGGCNNSSRKRDSQVSYAIPNKASIEDCYSKGRFPANVILDEEAAAMLDEQSGVSVSKPHNHNHKQDTAIYGGGKGLGIREGMSNFNDSGGASRFFYCAKASKAERNAGCEGLPKGEPPASARSKPAEGRKNPLGEPRQNYHPTVKPLALMEYLCKLTMTPTGGIVLDPFLGSGTTAIACVKTGRHYVGIEKDPDYCKIAEQRIQAEKEKYALIEN